MKVAIVMSYFRREYQLKKTLLSIGQSKFKDFAVVVIDDCSEDGLVMPETSYQCDLLRTTKEEKVWKDSGAAHNMAIIHALKNYKPEVVIIQNPECIHIGDVITYAAEHINNSNYTPFKCLSLDEKTTFDENVNLVELTQSIRHGASKNGDLAWYNHPVYRPCNLDFCCAISADNLIALNGYDERFMYGYAYGDNYWKYRIELMGLNFEVPDEPMVAHQWHFYPWYDQMVTPQLGNVNHDLYHRLITEGRARAEHLITPDFDTI